MEYIIKASPDEDWYCLWYTGPDAPGDFGTRQFLCSRYTLHADRFVRADANGTSMIDSDQGSWDDSGFMVRELFSEARFLPRGNLKDFCLAVQEDRQGTMLSLTKAYDDE